MKIKMLMGVGLLSLLTASCDNGYRTATVVKMVSVPPPDNLSGSSECQVLWNDLARFGIEMDNASKEWNKVVLNSAFFLVEKGCVKRAGAGF